ncbi:hypothetical protein IMZ48_26305 [Candidatus Bathyarchaeota archaeon]|nr:hypothetical protein [Candidatus Bathyarchaeota archaeon]
MKKDTTHITHVALAFIQSGVFIGEPPGVWPLFTTPDTQFQDGTKFLVAIGGWGDLTGGFDAAAKDPGPWSKNVAKMVKDLGADGVDIDWEYHGCVSLHPAFQSISPPRHENDFTDPVPGETATTTS